ncbi:MAG: hypothetical protein ABII71_05230 [Candidatus Micrarchaeota archaeon]
MARSKLPPRRRTIEAPDGPYSQYPGQLARGMKKIFGTMEQFPGGAQAVPHAKRLVDRLIHYNILEPDKIGDRKADPKSLNLKLGYLAAMHSFKESAVSKGILPPSIFSKHKHVVDGHDVLCALRDNDLGTQSSAITSALLENPSLGLLVWMADLTQCYEAEAGIAKKELGNLDPHVFHTHGVGEGSMEYRKLARQALNVYSQLADALDYRELSGDLMKMAYFHLNRELHDYVEQAFELTTFMADNTLAVYQKAKPIIEEELRRLGYDVEFHVREDKNLGKAMGKVEKKLREKGMCATPGAVLDEVMDLNDRVAFTIEVKKYDGKTVGQKDMERFDEVLLVAMTAINSITELRDVDPEKLIMGILDKEALMRKRIGKDGSLEEGLYRDYISSPKPNGYQSLHGDMRFVDADNFANLEIHVENSTMHGNSKTGSAAHALYKGGGPLARRAQRNYRNVLEAIARGGNGNGSAGVIRTINVQVVEINGKCKTKEVVLPEHASVADALAEADIDDFLNGLALTPPLRLTDKLGDVRKLEVRHSEGSGHLVGAMFDVASAATEAGQRALKKARQAVPGLFQKRNGNCK